MGIRTSADGEKLNLVRQPSTFPPPSAFVRSASSLIGYAPGMFWTPADMQAVLEEEVRERRPTLGRDLPIVAARGGSGAEGFEAHSPISLGFSPARVPRSGFASGPRLER